MGAGDDSLCLDRSDPFPGAAFQNQMADFGQKHFICMKLKELAPNGGNLDEVMVGNAVEFALADDFWGLKL